MIKLKSLLKEERAKTFEKFLWKDIIQHGYDIDKILGGHKWGEKLIQALVDTNIKVENHTYKVGDLEKRCRKYLGNEKVNKLERIWKS